MTLKNLYIWKSIKFQKVGHKLSWFSQFYFFLLWCDVRWRKNYDGKIQKVFLCACAEGRRPRTGLVFSHSSSSSLSRLASSTSATGTSKVMAGRGVGWWGENTPMVFDIDQQARQGTQYDQPPHQK